MRLCEIRFTHKAYKWSWFTVCFQFWYISMRSITFPLQSCSKIYCPSKWNKPIFSAYLSCVSCFCITHTEKYVENIYVIGPVHSQNECLDSLNKLFTNKKNKPFSLISKNKLQTIFPSKLILSLLKFKYDLFLCHQKWTILSLVVFCLWCLMLRNFDTLVNINIRCHGIDLKPK